MRGIDFACPVINIKISDYGKERTANAASGRTRSGIRGHDHQGEDQLPGRLQGQMGDSVQPPCRLYSDLHDRDTDVRSPYRGVSGAELRIGGLVRGQPQ